MLSNLAIQSFETRDEQEVAGYAELMDLVFILRSLAEQVRQLEKKVEREKTVLAALPELSLQIVELAREHGRVTRVDAQGPMQVISGPIHRRKVHYEAPPAHRLQAEMSESLLRGSGGLPVPHRRIGFF